MPKIKIVQKFQLDFLKPLGMSVFFVLKKLFVASVRHFCVFLKFAGKKNFKFQNTFGTKI